MIIFIYSIRAGERITCESRGADHHEAVGVAILRRMYSQTATDVLSVVDVVDLVAVDLRCPSEEQKGRGGY